MKPCARAAPKSPGGNPGGGTACAPYCIRATTGFVQQKRPGICPAFLLAQPNQAARRNRKKPARAQIPAGTTILSGGVTEAVAVKAGDHVNLRIQSLGSTSVRFI